MAKRKSKKAATPAATNGASLGFEEKLWQAADKLRGQVDAAEYKHVVLGLLFLKYISDAFESRPEQLRAELVKDGIPKDRHAVLLENPDDYTAERVFWVPEEARWDRLQAKAVDPKIAQHIDDAVLAVEASNDTLKGKLPRDYVRRGINPTKLGELITEVIAQKQACHQLSMWSSASRMRSSCTFLWARLSPS